MPRLLVLVAVFLALAGPAGADDLLADARRLYNIGNYEQAERAARQATDVPALANAARVVLGRICLEKYRRSAAPQDLLEARAALRAVDPRPLESRERVELTIGLAETLFFDDQFGGAAELFESVIETSSLLGPGAHERVLDWWATSLDRLAQAHEPAERPSIYERVVRRMSSELGRDPGSGPAGYWVAAAARGAGDLERAWHAATAGWVRAMLARDRGAALRADLDRLVVQAIIPERVARLGLKDTTHATAGMLAEWESFKTLWSR
jgi:tetratricopeptide (TPR) repeat protein